MLTEHDHKYWAPQPEVRAYLLNLIPASARVLDIGPGSAPFPRSDVCVDFQDSFGIDKSKLVICDLCSDPLPFRDKSFDFIYCRHVLEDMFNPFPLCSEMQRVGKAGYIETPSPVAELCRGIDGGSPYYRGYHHHRFVIWNHGGELRFVTKYPAIEYLVTDNEAIGAALRQRGGRYWNTHLLWKDEIKIRHMQNPLDFGMMQGYANLLMEAASESGASSDRFWGKL